MNAWRIQLPRLFLTALLLALAVDLLPPQGAIPPADAAGEGSLGFYPRTLVDFGPGGGGTNPGLLWWAASGDWVAYATGFASCGHCGLTTTLITLQNVLDGRTIKIHGALWTTNDASAGPVGMVRPAFVAPTLVWSQPGPPTPDQAKIYQYTPGDFACTVCMYDLGSGQGGSAAALAALAPPAPGPYHISAVALDRLNSGTALAFVDNSVTQPPGPANTLWLVNLKTGDKEQIPLTAPAFTISAATLYATVVAWNQDTHDQATSGLYLYRLADHSVHHIPNSAGAYNLQSDSVGLFWMDPVGSTPVVRRTDPQTGQTQLVVGGAETYQLCDVGIAWIEPAGQMGSWTLVVQQLSPSRTLLRQPLPMGQSPDQQVLTSLQAADQKLFLYNTAIYRGDIYGHPLSLQLAWLAASDPAFAATWAKADGPVAAGRVSRSWLWGPTPIYLGREAYQETQDGTRLVQYYDKSRMEINDPRSKFDNPYYVTNGLLVAEMIGGRIAVGDTAVITASIPATIPVAGDPRAFNPLTPGYADLAPLASLHGDHQAPNRTGQDVNDTVDAHGVPGKLPGEQPALAHYASFANQTGHNIPDVFWTYLQGMQATYGFDWTFVLGYPITEGYWTRMRVGGQDYRVLIQAYQRRVLTYAPDFPAAWQVQQGNVGQHYLEWRTRNLGVTLP